MLRLSGLVQAHCVEEDVSNLSIHTRLARTIGLPTSDKNDIEHLAEEGGRLSRRARDELDAIQTTATGASAKDDNVTDLVNRSTPSSHTPFFPPRTSRGLVCTCVASKATWGPIAKNKRTNEGDYRRQDFAKVFGDDVQSTRTYLK